MRQHDRGTGQHDKEVRNVFHEDVTISWTRADEKRMGQRRLV